MKNAYLLRGKPNGTDRVQTFLKEGIAAVGWPELDQNLSGLSKDRLKAMLAEKGYNQGVKLGSAAATLDLFVNRLQPGDLLLMPNSNDIYIGEVVSDYGFYANAVKDGLPHQRKVAWKEVPTTRAALSSELRSALKAWRTVANLSQFREEIEALSEGKVYAPEDAVPSASPAGLHFSLPLRDNFLIHYEIPADLTQEEARKLKAFLGSQRAYLDEMYGPL